MDKKLWLNISNTVLAPWKAMQAWPSDLYTVEWILYTGLLPVLAWRGEISLVAPKSIYIAAGLGIKKISFPFSVHHSPYNTRLLSTKGESAISLMQCRTCTNVLRRAI
jgi:hypothetical protein